METKSSDLTGQDILDFIGDDIDSDLACLCEALGPEGVLDLISVCGGSTIYVPNLEAVRKLKRNRIIAKEFQDGLSIAQLARRHGVTTRTIYSIVYGK